VQRARSIRFNTISEVLSQKYPDASKSKIRKLAISRADIIGKAFVAMIEKTPEAAKELIHEIGLTHMENIEERVLNPLLAGDPNGHTMKSEEALWLSNLAHGIEFCYVCRHKECLYFGLNSEWVRHKHKEWFKCPACGKKYSPQSTAHGEVDRLAFVLQLPNVLTGDMNLIPTNWPPSDETGWICKMIEIEARKVKTQADIELWRAKSALNLQELINAQRIPLNFEEMTPDPEIDGLFSEAWAWTEFKQRKYRGTFLPKEWEIIPFEDWTEIIALLADVVAAERAVNARDSAWSG
jgi:hypothetical protein